MAKRKNQGNKELRRGMLAPESSVVSSREYRTPTTGSIMLAHDMELSMFTEDSGEDDGSAPVALSDQEENYQMAALAWAHDVETDIETVLLPSLEDGSWKRKVRAYELSVFGVAETMGFSAKFNEYKRQIEEATVTVARARKAAKDDDSPGES